MSDTSRYTEADWLHELRKKDEMLERQGEIIATLRDCDETNSVLQDWVMQLPLRAQGTLLTGIRGCDLVPKLPLDSTERQLVGYLRNCVMNAADPREIGIVGAFFQPEPPQNWKASEFGHYPQHWVSHIMHCYEVIGYMHPDFKTREKAIGIYRKIVHSFHLSPETKDEMIRRLTEDRIVTGTVV